MAELVTKLRGPSAGLSQAEIDLQRSAAADLIELLSKSGLAIMKRAQEVETANRASSLRVAELEAVGPDVPTFRTRIVALCMGIADQHLKRSRAPHLFPLERVREKALCRQARRIAKTVLTVKFEYTEAKDAARTVPLHPR